MASTGGTPPSLDSCRKKKKEHSTFFEDLRDHIDEFINSSMDEHVDCFRETFKKMYRKARGVTERNLETKKVENVLPLKASVDK